MDSGGGWAVRRFLGAVVGLVAVLVLTPSALAGTPQPISFLEDFKDGPENSFWQSADEFNVETDPTLGLMVGPEAALGYVTTRSLANKKPDIVVTADLNLADAWAFRIVTVRVERDGSTVCFGSVTAWKESRNDTATKVRLKVGIVDGDTDQEVVDDGPTTGTLELRLDGATSQLTASYGGQNRTVPLAAGTNVTKIRLEIEGDPVLVKPSVESFNANSIN